MNPESRKNSDIDNGAIFLALLLILFYSLSLGGRYHWILEAYTNIIPQYCLAGFILTFFFMLRKSWIWCGLMLVISLSASYETALAVHHPGWQNIEQKSFKIAHFNKLYWRQNHEEIRQWIDKEQPDILILQEADPQTEDLITRLKDYPFRLYKILNTPFGMAFLSKHPVENATIQSISGHLRENFFIHAIIKIENLPPLSFYTVHPTPPVSHIFFKNRNRELGEITDVIMKDPYKNIILTGDLNITPYSPHFQDIKEKTGLKDGYTSLLPPPTWPSHHIFQIFQIPIDHILFKGDLALIKRSRGPSMGSDHYPVIAEFAITKEN